VIDGEMPGMNEIIKAAKSHYQAYNKLKREYTNKVAWVAKGKGKFNRIDLDIVWYCKDKRRDKDNIIAGGTKMILDGLVKAGMIKNDGWAEIGYINNYFEIDKENARIEVNIYGE